MILAAGRNPSSDYAQAEHAAGDVRAPVRHTSGRSAMLPIRSGHIDRGIRWHLVIGETRPPHRCRDTFVTLSP
jgi:hypothetical protein